MIAACWLKVASHELGNVIARAATVQLTPSALHRATVQALVESVTVGSDHVEVTCSVPAIAALLQVEPESDAPASITLRSEVTLARSGTALRLVQADGSTLSATPNAALLRLILRARRWWRILREGKIDISTLAANEGVQNAYVTRVLRLAFLAPAVVDALLAGTLRAGVDGAALTATGGVPPLWSEQIAAMLPGQQ